MQDYRVCCEQASCSWLPVLIAFAAAAGPAQSWRLRGASDPTCPVDASPAGDLDEV